MNAISVNGYTRITKQAAHKLYDAHKMVYVCPVKLRPSEYTISGIYKANDKHDFALQVSVFQYYNCNNNEVGKYAAFYTKD